MFVDHDPALAENQPVAEVFAVLVFLVGSRGVGFHADGAVVQVIIRRAASLANLLFKVLEAGFGRGLDRLLTVEALRTLPASKFANLPLRGHPIPIEHAGLMHKGSTEGTLYQ